MSLAVFRCDASATIGMGHLIRCMALADALAERGWRSLVAGSRETVELAAKVKEFRHRVHEVPAGDSEVATLIRLCGSESPVLVVDHYGWDAERDSACRPWAPRIVCIDDLANRAHDCDVLIDPNLGRAPSDYSDLVPGHCRVLAGADYALLRAQFARARPASLVRRRDEGPVRTVLVMFGGGVQQDEVGIALTGLEQAGFSGAVDVVSGPASSSAVADRAGCAFQVRRHVNVSDMAELASAADVAVGAAGTGTLERLCLGIPSIVALTADNQGRQFSALRDLDAAETVDMLRGPSPSDVARAFIRLSDPARRQQLSERGARLCDGLGAQRAAAAIAGTELPRVA